MIQQLEIRPAELTEESSLTALVERSVRGLQTADYTAEQIESALGSVLVLDKQLIRDGTFFSAYAGGMLAGCGGWSKRSTLFGVDHHSSDDDPLLNPERDAARIRAFFIDPAFARRGIATAILAACESAAATAGFKRLELGATLTGVPLYLARGYAIVKRFEVMLPNGSPLPIVRMAKSIETP